MTINFTILNFYYFIAGFMCATFIFILYSKKLNKEIKTLKRLYEKKSIGADDSDLRVKTLENKIKSLEIALKKQMENS